MSYLTYQGKMLQSTHKYLISAAAGPINYLTSLSNVNFDTFSASGRNLNSAIALGGSFETGRTNNVNITAVGSPYVGIQFIFFLTMNSGTLIRVPEYHNNSIFSFQTFTYSGPGYYTVGSISFSPVLIGFGFINGAGQETCNFSATDCQIYVTNGTVS